MSTYILPNGKPHISYSEVKTWSECSWRHYLQNVKKISQDKPSIHLFFGTACHAAVEYYMNNGEISYEESDKVIDEAWELNSTLEDFIKNPAEQMKNSVKAIMEEFPEFLDAKFPGWQPVQAEEQLYEGLGQYFEKHEGVSFKGFIDIIIKVPGKKPNEWIYWIIDLKTANRPWNKEKIADPLVRMQLILYKEFWAKKHKIPLSSIRCAFLTVLKKGKKGKLCSLIPISVGDVTIKRSLAVINSCVSTMKRGFALKNRNSCKWCEFRDTEFCT